jgi:hypothetical protein
MCDCIGDLFIAAFFMLILYEISDVLEAKRKARRA